MLQRDGYETVEVLLEEERLAEVENGGAYQLSVGLGTHTLKMPFEPEKKRIEHDRIPRRSIAEGCTWRTHRINMIIESLKTGTIS